MRSKRRSSGSVSRKGRLWYAVLTIGRSATGEQLRQWSRGFPTRRDAEQHLAQLLIEGRSAPRTRTTVHDLVERYIECDIGRKGKRSPTTTERYRGLLKNMSPIGTHEVDTLEGSTIEGLYEQLLARDLSHTTVHHVHNLLFAAIAWGARKSIGLVTRNPFSYDDDPQAATRNEWRPIVYGGSGSDRS